VRQIKKEEGMKPFNKIFRMIMMMSLIGASMSACNSTSPARETNETESMYDVKIVTREESEIVAFVLHTTFVGEQQARDVPPFFHNIMDNNLLESIPNRINKNHICLFDKKQDSPDFDYYMGVEIASIDSMPDNMKTFTIPETQYATTSFVKTGNADVMQAIMYVTEKWMPEHHLTQNFNFPVFINYDKEFISVYKSEGYAGKPIAKLYVPINP
jgi:predicted transcriptional regulator YdeE